MSTIDEASTKKLSNEGSIGKNVLEILKEILTSFSFLSNEFFTYILMVFVILHLLLHHL
jgi:hypothetical protein